MTNREIQKLDTLIEETENEELLFLYKRMRRAYNKFFVRTKVEIGSKETLLIEQKKEISKFKKKIKEKEELISILREEIDRLTTIPKIKRRRRRINE